MINQQGRTTCSTIAFVRTFQRLWRRTTRLFRRYAEWQEIKRHHDALLRMDDRMLRDIGLTRTDIRKIMRSHTFWRHMSRPDARERECEANPKKEAVCNPVCVINHPASDFSLRHPG